MQLFLDTETFSPIPIKHGTARYATQVEVILVTWAIDDGPVQIWDVGQDADLSGMPESLQTALETADEIIAHNAYFDRTVLAAQSWCMPIPLGKWRCTMAMALAHGLPGGLEHLCNIFKVDLADAKQDGKDLINTFCKPQGKAKTRISPNQQIRDWRKFCEYAKHDISAMRSIYRKMPKWNCSPFETNLWHLDQTINSRGVAVDVAFADAAVKAITMEQKLLGDRTVELTDGEVEKTTQRDRLLGHLLREYGVELPDLRADTVERRLEDPELPEFVKELLRIRLQASKSSSSKYKRLLQMEVGGRLYGTLQYCAANRTGRWGGRGVQPQNLPRPSHKAAEIERGIAAAKAGCLDLITDNVMAIMSSALRGSLIAGPGKKLCISDLKNIEGRKLAWLAGEQWKIDAFAAFDRGESEDMYKVSYGRAFDVDPASVEDDSDERQIGKVCLSGDTLVLSESSWKRLDTITNEDLVWDGDHWTKHGGLVCNGWKPVVNLCGISLTPDHLVWCGDQWHQAQYLVDSKENTSQALAIAAASLPSQDTSRPKQGAGCTELSLNAIAGSLNTWWKRITSRLSKLRDVIFAQRKQPMLNISGNTYQCCPMTSTGVGSLIGLPQLLEDVPSPMIGATIIMAVEEFSCTPSGGQIEHLSYNTYKRFRDGMTRSWRWIARTLTAITNRVISVSSADPITIETDEKYLSSKPNALVYDLLSVGSKHRFMVMSKQGPLLVHNCELALGYAGGVGAFVTMAATYGVDLELMAKKAAPAIPAFIMREAEGTWRWAEQNKRVMGLTREVYIICEALKRLWRLAHPATVQLWEDMETAALLAIQNPKEVFKAGPHIEFSRVGAWLRMKLPSGRYLCYPNPKADGSKITYVGVSTYSHQWSKISTYGGKLAENATQASSRDIMASAMFRAEESGYPLVLTVHDELMTEVPDREEFNHKTLNSILATNPPWAVGLPLAADGSTKYRYGKG